MEWEERKEQVLIQCLVKRYGLKVNKAKQLYSEVICECNYKDNAKKQWVFVGDKVLNDIFEDEISEAKSEFEKQAEHEQESENDLHREILRSFY